MMCVVYVRGIMMMDVTLCKYDLRKGDLFVLSLARVQRVRRGTISSYPTHHHHNQHEYRLQQNCLTFTNYKKESPFSQYFLDACTNRKWQSTKLMIVNPFATRSRSQRLGCSRQGTRSRCERLADLSRTILIIFQIKT